jgi:hypothetical protein
MAQAKITKNIELPTGVKDNTVLIERGNINIWIAESRSTWLSKKTKRGHPLTYGKCYMMCPDVD